MADEMNNYIYFQYKKKIIDKEYAWILRSMVGIKGEDVVGVFVNLASFKFHFIRVHDKLV